MADGGIIETLKILIQADDKGLESGVTNAVKKASFSLKSAISSFIMPVFGALMSGQFIKQTYEEVINLDHLSTSLGVNVERLQMWQGAAKDAGSSAEAVGVMWQRMNAMITDFSVNGTGTLKELAEKGVVPALTTIDGKVKDTDTYLLELADTLHNMDAQAASGIGRKLGIRDFNLMNFLQQGSGEINQQLKHIKDLGVYTMRDVEIARDFDVALNDVTRVMKMSLVPIFRIVTPLISKLGNGLVELRKHWMVLLPVIGLIASNVMGSMIPAFADLYRIIKPLLNLKMAGALAALVLLGLALEDIYVWIQGGESVIGEYLGTWEEFKPKIQPAIDAVDTLIQTAKELAPTFNNFFEEAKPLFFDLLGVIIRFSADVAQVFLSTVGYALEGFVIPLLKAFKAFQEEGIGGLLNALAELPEKMLSSLAKAAKVVYDIFIEPVSRWFSELSSKILNFFSLDFSGKIAKMSVRGGGGSFDNSNHSTDISNKVDIHVDSKQDAVDISRGLMSRPLLPSLDTAYGGTP